MKKPRKPTKTKAQAEAPKPTIQPEVPEVEAQPEVPETEVPEPESQPEDQKPDSSSEWAAFDLELKALRIALRKNYSNFEIKKPNPKLVRDLKPGWMLPYLIPGDRLLYGRWDYWEACSARPGYLPEAPIPQIDFLMHPHERTKKMLTTCLDSISRSGGWLGWGSWTNFNYFLDWILFGLGHHGQPILPEEPVGCEGASMRLYQIFDLGAMQAFPYDYFADLLAESNHGKGSGFYPTPHTVVEMTVRMTMNTQKDNRLSRVIDPCCGTGRFPLHASNYSLRLVGQDIDQTVLKTCLVNGYLYAPWLVKPIRWIDGNSLFWGNSLIPGSEKPFNLTGEEEFDHFSFLSENLEPIEVPPEELLKIQEAQRQKSKDVSDQMTETAPAHTQGYLFETEHDTEEQWKFEPLKKRKRKATAPEKQDKPDSPPDGLEQLSLF